MGARGAVFAVARGFGARFFLAVFGGRLGPLGAAVRLSFLVIGSVWLGKGGVYWERKGEPG